MSTNLVMMHPPGAGDDFGVPGLRVAHGHGSGFAQGLGWNGTLITARRGRKTGLVLDDDGGGTVQIRVNVNVAGLREGVRR